MISYRAFSLIPVITVVACLAGTAIAETWELPPPLSESEVQAFSEKFANADKNPDATESSKLNAEFVSRTAGLKIRREGGFFQFIQPAGMSDEEFKQRKCDNQRALEQIYPQERLEKVFQLARKMLALVEVFETDALELIPEAIKCRAAGYDLDGRLMTDALSWAREIKKGDPEDLRRLESQHRKLTGGIFDNVPPANYDRVVTTPDRAVKAFHLAFADVVGAFADRIESEVAAKEEKPPIKVVISPMPSAEVWFRALPGDVNAQMEMAVTYETGYLDFRSTYRAHYWYYIAWRNGAGTVALDGANRTRAELTEAEKKLVDEMIATDQPPTLY